MEDTKGLADGSLNLSSDEPNVSSINLVPGLQSGGRSLDGAQVPNSWSVCKVLTIDLALR